MIYLIEFKLFNLYIFIYKMETKNEIDIFKVATPIDVIKQSLGKEVFVKCKFNRELKGKLHLI